MATRLPVAQVSIPYSVGLVFGGWQRSQVSRRRSCLNPLFGGAGIRSDRDVKTPGIQFKSLNPLFGGAGIRRRWGLRA